MQNYGDRILWIRKNLRKRSIEYRNINHFWGTFFSEIISEKAFWRVFIGDLFEELRKDEGHFREVPFKFYKCILLLKMGTKGLLTLFSKFSVQYQQKPPGCKQVNGTSLTMTVFSDVFQTASCRK